MGRALFDAIPAARTVFEQVDDALGEKLSALIFDGPMEELTLTANAQPAIMATSLAAVRALEERSGVGLADMVGHVAGHSLGEYSALASMGAISVEDAARLLRVRGLAMQEAVPVGEGAMAAVLGLSTTDVEAVAVEASGEDSVCEVANDNSEGQAVLSGTRKAVEQACALAKARGAKRAMLLQVSAPFHCRLMEPAAERLAEALAECRFHPPARPVIANVLAEPCSDPQAFADLLTRQVTGRVRWRESMGWMASNGVDGALELGAGKVLTGLARRGLKGAALANIATPEDIDTVLATLEGRS